MIRRFSPAAAALVMCTASLLAQSFYPLRPNDPIAAYLPKEHFDVYGDGIADD